MHSNIIVRKINEDLQTTTRFSETKKLMQHGNTSVYEHSLAVAIKSYQIAAFLNIKVDKEALIRGALLHDYFLYDWHEHDNGEHRWHGFTHARKAWENAKRDLNLSPIESDIILRHMFPLNLTPPSTREAWLVCLADKLCATGELLKPFTISVLIKKNLGTKK